MIKPYCTVSVANDLKTPNKVYNNNNNRDRQHVGQMVDKASLPHVLSFRDSNMDQLWHSRENLASVNGCLYVPLNWLATRTLCSHWEPNQAQKYKKRKEKKLWWSYWQNSIYNCLARQLHLTKIAKCMSNNNQHTAKLLDLHTWEPKIYQICWSLFGWVPPTAQKHQGVTNLFGTRYITLAILIHAMGYLFDRHIWNYIFVQTTLNIFLTIIPDIYLWDNSISALSTNQETTQLHVLAYR